MEKTEFKELKKQLLSTKKNGYDRPLDEAAMESYCNGYKAFLDAGKTERLCAAEVIRLAEGRGYRTSVTEGRRYCWPTLGSGLWRKACRSPLPTSTRPGWT